MGPERQTTEENQTINRYHRLKTLGIRQFKNSPFIETGIVSEDSVLRATELFKIATPELNPPVRASFWEHILIAPELGKQIAHSIKDKNLVNPQSVELALWLHEIGRLVTPGAYFRNDLIDRRLLVEFGLPRSFIDQDTFSLGSLLDWGAKLKLNENQLTFASPFDPVQKALAQKYFDLLTPTQRIVNLADNLGKRDSNGLFAPSSFFDYLKTQEKRLTPQSPWPSEQYAITNRRASAVLQKFVIEKTFEWLTDLGVDYTQIRNDLLDFGPKFVLLIRHADIDNKRQIVYNRDNLMRSEDIIHISSKGITQIESFVEVIGKPQTSETNPEKGRGFVPEKIYFSPEIRTRETAEVLKKALAEKGIEVEIILNQGIDEVYAPGPYELGWKMSDLEKAGGNVYSKKWREKFKHETPNQVVGRMNKGFQEIVNELRPGQTGAIVSHGDPLAWLANYLNLGKIPKPDKLRGLIYPPKGAAVVVIIGPKGAVFAEYLLAGYPLKEGTTY